MTKIVVDRDGNILDGHNRLRAYVKLRAESFENHGSPVVDKFRPEEVIEMDDELLSKLID